MTPRPVCWCHPVAFRTVNNVGLRMAVLSGLNHAACSLAVYASQAGSPRAHARLATGWPGQPWPGGTLTRWVPSSPTVQGTLGQAAADHEPRAEQQEHRTGDQRMARRAPRGLDRCVVHWTSGRGRPANHSPPGARAYTAAPLASSLRPPAFRCRHDGRSDGHSTPCSIPIMSDDSRSSSPLQARLCFPPGGSILAPRTSHLATEPGLQALHGPIRERNRVGRHWRAARAYATVW